MLILSETFIRSSLVVTGLFLIITGIGIIACEIRRWILVTRLRRMVKKIEKEGLENIKAEVKEL